MKIFVVNPIRVKCGEVNGIGGRAVFVSGSVGTTTLVGGDVWGVEAQDWWDARRINVVFLQKVPLAKMYRDFPGVSDG